MFKTLFSSKAKKTICLYLGMKSIAICEENNGQSTLLAGEKIESDAEWPSVLKRMVSEHSLKQLSVSVVVSRKFYQTFDIDKPKLEEKELLATLPFSVKDLVSESIFDLVVDYFDKPAQVRKDNQITVVCIPKARVITIRDMLMDNELTLQSITTQEMAVCQLFEQQEEANILLSEQGNELVLYVVKSGQLYFSLRIRGYKELLPLPLEEVENVLIDGLSLEIQRALDYINTQLRIQMIGGLYLAVKCPDIDSLATKLADYIGQNVKPFPEKYDYNFLYAYGGFDKGNDK